MNCRNEKCYCQKIFDKVNQKVFVDDKGCAKCNGNPKMPQPTNAKTKTKAKKDPCPGKAFTG